MGVTIRVPVMLLAGIIAACAEDLPVPQRPALDASASCARFVLERERLRVSDALPDQAWTAVTYDLDGSGRAQQLHIEASSGSMAFDAAVLRSYANSRFDPAVVKRGCRDQMSVVRSRG